MTQKTISLSVRAYNELRKEKKKDESFSKTIIRILKNRNQSNIKSLAGAFNNNSEEWGNIEKILYDNRIDESDLDTEEIEA